jgi:hypothetical protein
VVVIISLTSFAAAAVVAVSFVAVTNSFASLLLPKTEAAVGEVGGLLTVQELPCFLVVVLRGELKTTDPSTIASPSTFTSFSSPSARFSSSFTSLAVNPAPGSLIRA